MKQTLITIALSLGLGLLLGYFIFSPKIETVAASIQADTGKKTVIVGRIDTLWRTQTHRIFVRDTVYPYVQASDIVREDTIDLRDSIPIGVKINFDTAKTLSNVVTSQVQLDTKFYGGRLLDTKVWLDPIYFPYRKTTISEWRGFPWLSYMMSARVVHNYAIGVGLNIDRFGIMINAPIEKDLNWDAQLIIHF